MTRNLRSLTLALVALLVVALPASSLAKHRGKVAQASPQSVGSVSAFSGDVLAIEVADGSKITGRVVPRTLLGCSRGIRGGHFLSFHAVAIVARASRHGRDEHRGPARGGAPAGPTGATGPAGSQIRGVGGTHRRCDLSMLRVGTKVLAADLTLTADGPVWRRVVFLTPAPAGPTGATGPADPGNTT
jgi:hypothetical protein